MAPVTSPPSCAEHGQGWPMPWVFGRTGCGGSAPDGSAPGGRGCAISRLLGEPLPPRGCLLRGRLEMNPCPASRSRTEGSGRGKRESKRDGPAARGGELSSAMIRALAPTRQGSNPTSAPCSCGPLLSLSDQEDDQKQQLLSEGINKTTRSSPWPRSWHVTETCAVNVLSFPSPPPVSCLAGGQLQRPPQEQQPAGQAAPPTPSTPRTITLLPLLAHQLGPEVGF